MQTYTLDDAFNHRPGAPQMFNQRLQATTVPGSIQTLASVCGLCQCLDAPATFEGEIGNAAKKLGDASCDFAKEVDWNRGIFLQVLGQIPAPRGAEDHCQAVRDGSRS